MILDIHSHRVAPYPEGVINPQDLQAEPAEGQAYSFGIHPWDTASEIDEESWARLAELVRHPQVVAVGECGIDLTKGGPLYRQLQVLKRQIELSEEVGKPLVLHCVKGADIILGLKRDLQPLQPWIIHGFRGKPSLARQLTDKGIFLSFGEKFNAETVMEMPDDKILAETDDSILTIEEIIGNLSEAGNRDLSSSIAANTRLLIPWTPSGF